MKVLKSIIKTFMEYLILFFIGGCIYYSLEIVWRGHSHWSMFILGGVCLIAVGLINEILPWTTFIEEQILIGTGVITLLEFIAGLILNIWLDLGIWDYSDIPLNFMGQICIPFIVIWIILAATAILLDDRIRYAWFDEEEPVYVSYILLKIKALKNNKK